MDVDLSTFFSPSKFINFRENEKEYENLIDKLEPNSYTILEGLIKEINNDLEKKLEFDVDHYMKQFELDKVFSEEILYKLRNPQFIKSFENIKGTIKSFVLIARLFNIDVTVDFMKNVFLYNQTIDRSLYDYDSCAIDISTHIDLDEASEKNEKISEKSLGNASTIKKVAENVIHACIFIRSLIIIFSLKDTYDKSKMKDEITFQHLFENHNEFFKCMHYGDFSYNYDSIYCNKDNVIKDELIIREYLFIKENVFGNYDDFNYDGDEDYYTNLHESSSHSIKEIVNEKTREYEEVEIETIKDPHSDNYFIYYGDFYFDDNIIFHQFGESFTITQR